jgi:hypothetical protein
MVKTAHSIEGCERTDSEKHHTVVCGIKKSLEGHEGREIESEDSKDETEFVTGKCIGRVTDFEGTMGFIGLLGATK